MNLANARSIHMPSGPSDGGRPQGPLSETSSETKPVHLRKVPRSPIQEFQARSARIGGTDPLPDALAAILFYEHKRPTIDKKGRIIFQLEGTDYKFYHPDCLTCHPANAGKQIRVSFNRDELDCVFVLSDDGRYVETVPRDGKHDWFSKEAGAEIAKYRRVATHVHEHLKRIHAPDTKAEHERVKSNAEKLQYLNTFPVPGARATAATADSQETIHAPGDRVSITEAPRFENAEQIVAAARLARRQREAGVAAEREEENLAELARKARMADYKAPTLFEEQQQ